MRPEASRAHIFVFFAALLLSVSLTLSVITWGLPSKARQKLYFESEESLQRACRRAAEYVAGGKWQRSHLTPDDPEVEAARTWFNLIRTYNADEHDVIKPLAGMRPARLDFNPHRFAYPAFFTYQVGFFSFVLGKMGLITVVPDIAFYLKNPGQFARIYLVGRVLALLYGMGVVFLTLLVGRRLFGPGPGAWAAAITASSTVFIAYQGFVKIDMPGMFWVLLSLFFAVRYIQEGGQGPRDVVLAGAFSGLAAGTKYNLGVCLASVVLAALFAGPPRKRVLRVLVASLASGLAFLLVNPYILISFNEFLKDFTYAAGVVKGRFLLEELLDNADYLFFVLPRAGSPLFAILITAGLVYGIIRLKREEAPLFVYLILTVLVLVKARAKLAGYTLTVIPVAAVYGAGLLEKLFKKRRPIAWAVVVVTVASNFALAYAAVSLMRHDTRMSAGLWISENIPAGSRVGLVGPQLAFSSPPVDEDRYWVVDIMKEKRPEWAVLSEYFYRDYLTGGSGGVLAPIVDSRRFAAARVFSNQFMVLGLNLGFTRKTPLDLIQLAPEITIFKRVPGPDAPR